MRSRTTPQQILKSAEFATYSLRSSFFLRRLRAMRLWEVVDEVHRLVSVKESFSWDRRDELGIDEEAWKQARDWRIEPLLFFCHPRVLEEQPRLLLYYRTVCLISQKGLASLIGSEVARIESDESLELSRERASLLAIALNCIASGLIKTAAHLETSHLTGLQFATAGATIQGSWNNAVGAEGEAAVRTILANHLRQELAQIVWKNGLTSDYQADVHESLIDHIDEVKVLRLKQGFHLRFSSEPDVSLRDRDDVPWVAVEVKAGNDPAGALERLGAAMKSFENDRNINPRLKTVYVVQSMTPELEKRIREGNSFDHTFHLSELLVDERTQTTFANLLLRVVLAGSRKGPKSSRKSKR